MIFALALAAALNLEPPSVRVSAEVNACANQPQLAWCAKRSSAADAKPITESVLLDYSKKTMRGFMLRNSTATGKDDIFQSFYADASAGKFWHGDCDNIVYTALEWLDADGYNMTDVYRVLVSTNGGEHFNHMVAVAVIDGQWMVFADSTRIGKVYPLDQAKWRPLYAAKNNTDKWYRNN